MSGIISPDGFVVAGATGFVASGFSVLEYLCVALAVAAAAYFLIARIKATLAGKSHQDCLSANRTSGCCQGCAGCPQAGKCHDKTGAPHIGPNF